VCHSASLTVEFIDSAEEVVE